MATSVPDSNNSTLLRLLADLSADPKQTRKALALFEHRPASKSADPHTCVASPGCGFLGENMLNPRKRSDLPHIQWRSGEPGNGGTARLVLYQEVLLADGSLAKRNVPYPFGKVSMEEAVRLRAELLAKDAKRTAPVSLITVKQFIDQRYLPDRVAKLSLSSRNTYESILRVHVIQA